MQNNGSILVVDDDRDIQATIRMILEFEGHKVDTVSNGKEALHFIDQSGLPALIILDMMMPVMDGMEFLETFEAQKENSHVPVIVTSAALVKGQTLKNRVLIEKPFEVKKLLKMVSELGLNTK